MGYFDELDNEIDYTNYEPTASDYDIGPPGLETKIVDGVTGFMKGAGATAQLSFNRLPIPSMIKMQEIRDAGGLIPGSDEVDGNMVDIQTDDMGHFVTKDIRSIIEDPDFDIDNYKAQGMKTDPTTFDSFKYMTQDEWKKSVYFHPNLEFPSGVNTGVAKILKERKEVELNRQEVLSESPQNIVAQIGYFGVGLGTEFADPLNVGLMMVPIAGEAKWLGALGKNRFVRRGVKGGIEGLVGNIPAEYLAYEGLIQEQAAWTLEDSMFNVMVMGPLAGAGLRNVVGGYGDIKGIFTSLDDIVDNAWRTKPLQDKEALTLKGLEDLDNDTYVNIQPMGDAQVLSKLTPEEILAQVKARNKELTDTTIPKTPHFDLEESNKYGLFDETEGWEIDNPIRRAALIDEVEGRLTEIPYVREEILLDGSIDLELDDGSTLFATKVSPGWAKSIDGDYRLGLTEAEMDRTLQFDLVQAETEGIGIGTQLVERLIKHADDNDLTLIGTAIGSGKLQGVDLEQWYSNRGFEIISGPDQLPRILKRPKQIAKPLKVKDDLISDEDMLELTTRVGPPIGVKIGDDQSINIDLEDRSFLNTTRLDETEAKMYDTDYQTYLRDDELKRVLHLNFVESTIEGKGAGTNMLKTLTEHADETNLIVIGTPAGTGKLTGEALEAWYEKFGFTMIKEPNENVKMIRFPAELEPIERISTDELFNKGNFPDDLGPRQITKIKGEINRAQIFADENNIKYNGPWYFGEGVDFQHTFTVMNGKNKALTFVADLGEDLDVVYKSRAAENQANMKKAKEAIVLEDKVAAIEEVTVREDGTPVAPRIDDEAISKNSIELIMDSGSNAQLSKKSPRMARNFAKMDKFDLTPEQAENFWEFNRLNTEVQGKGEGTKLINRVLDIADEQGITIYNNPNAYKDAKAALNQEQLESWYARKGFEKLEDTATPTMVRYPKEISPVKGADPEVIAEVIPDKVKRTPREMMQLQKQKLFEENKIKFTKSLEERRQSELDATTKLHEATMAKLDAETRKLTFGQETSKYDLYDRSIPNQPKLITDPTVRTRMIFDNKLGTILNDLDYNGKRKILIKEYAPTEAEKLDIFTEDIAERIIDRTRVLSKLDNILSTDVPIVERIKRQEVIDAERNFHINELIMLYTTKFERMDVVDRIVADTNLGSIYDYGGTKAQKIESAKTMIKDFDTEVNDLHYNRSSDFRIKLDKLKTEFKEGLKDNGLTEIKGLNKARLDEIQGLAPRKSIGDRIIDSILRAETGDIDPSSILGRYTKLHSNVFNKQLEDFRFNETKNTILDTKAFLKKESLKNIEKARIANVTTDSIAKSLNNRVESTGFAVAKTVVKDSPMDSTYNADMDIEANRTYTKEDLQEMELSGEPDQVTDQWLDASNTVARKLQDEELQLTKSQREDAIEVLKQIREEHTMRVENFDKIVNTLMDCI